MKYQDINALAVDRWVDAGWEWGKPVSHETYLRALAGDWSVLLTPTKPVPREWFGELRGRRLLGLASGGGQQIPLFTAAGAHCTVLDFSERQLESERMVAAREGYTAEIVRADMTKPLPFADESFDVVMSSIGVMFAPHHQPAADELVRTCRPGGTIGLLSWTPEGMLGALFATIKPFAPPPPPGASSPPLWGSETHLHELFGDRVDFHSVTREVLEITAFDRPRDYAEHFKAYYGPTIAARANAVRNGVEAEFDAALDAFCDEWSHGTSSPARFEKEYLLAVGTRR